jgi:putative ABC transport system permease protein
VLVSNAVAWPIAYIVMTRWLQNFAYRIDLSIWIFLVAGVIAMAIALLTVGYQTVKAAIVNPVHALRYE